MKTLALLTLLATTGCQAITIGVGAYKADQAFNHIIGGTDTLTVTEDDYNACKAGDEAACNRCKAYSVAFIPADTVAALATKPSNLGKNHCEIWVEAAKHIPTISQRRDDYGGADYYAFIKKGR